MANDGVYVLDAWAIMAALGGEPARAQVETIISRSPAPWMTSINLGEVIYATARKRGWRHALMVRDSLLASPIRFAPAHDELILEAAKLKSQHRMSYADAFAAALALDLKATLATGDAEFLPLSRTDGLSLLWLEGRVKPAT